MSITLITAVPGGGKTIYAVWHIIKKAVEEERIIYTAAIPELKLPTIRVSYQQIRKWHEREKIESENNVDLPEDEIPTRLLNFKEGSVIVIDEVQNLWPSTGSKEATEDINYLTKHRHHGLEIILITQAPQLVHVKVLAVVDKHLHIRKSWFGRQIFEWPEYCSTTRAVSSRVSAVRKPYKIPKQAFGLYRSASMHVKQKMTVPVMAYIIPVIILFIAFMAHKSYNAVMVKTIDDENQIAQTEEIKNETQSVTHQTQPAPVPNPIQPSTPIPQILPVAHPVVSDRVDWEKVSACLSTKDKCICYGHNAERLVIPPETCRIAVQHGWPGKNVVITATNL